MKIHTIQLNIESFLGGTNHMDAVELGAYMSLLVACYQSNNSIPSEEQRLARMARVSLKVWRRIEPVVGEKFTKSEQRWSHERVQKEIVRYSTLSSKNKSNALKKNNSPKPVASQPHSQTAANTSNKEQITNPPIPPKGNGVLNGVFKIEDFITPQATDSARSEAPGWDINYLMGVYNEGIKSGQRGPPRKPNQAFPAWCGVYTKGKSP